jgi:hypothetical protein
VAVPVPNITFSGHVPNALAFYHKFQARRTDTAGCGCPHDTAPAGSYTMIDPLALCHKFQARQAGETACLAQLAMRPEPEHHHISLLEYGSYVWLQKGDMSYSACQTRPT